MFSFKVIAVYAVVFFLAAQNAVALNGMAFAFAQGSTVAQVKSAVGAIGYMDTIKVTEDGKDVEKRYWKVAGNVIYIGEHAGGSALLTSAQALTTREGSINDEVLQKARIRFGLTISEMQSEFNVLREEFKLPNGTRVEIHPDYIPSNSPNYKLQETKRADLALILLPYTLEGDYRPITMAGVNAPVAMDSVYYTFGFGAKFDKADKEEVPLTDLEIAQSSGFLRWTPVLLKSEWEKLSLFRTVPLSERDHKTFFRSIPAEPDAWVDGPCSNDHGAPLILEGGVIPRPGETNESARRIVLLGTYNASSGTCRKPQKDAAGNFVEANIAYVDLRDAVFANWIAKHVTRLPKL